MKIRDLINYKIERKSSIFFNDQSVSLTFGEDIYLHIDDNDDNYSLCIELGIEAYNLYFKNFGAYGFNKNPVKVLNK